MNNSTFPCLRRRKYTTYNRGATGIIVRFSAPTVGVVVNNDDAHSKVIRHVGFESNTWLQFDSEKDWEPVDGHVDQFGFIPDRWHEAAIEMAQYVHTECVNVPHDIGLKLMAIIEKHFKLK